MKYLGSKSFIAKKIADYIQNDSDYETFFEPFAGSLSVSKYFGDYDTVILNDLHPDLIKLWIDLKNDELIIPSEISETDYNLIKTMESPNSLKAIAGFGLSWGGKWFAGYSPKYIKSSRKRDFLNEFKTSLMKLKPFLQKPNVLLDNRDYADFTPIGMTIYCDPPYENTTGYGEKFNSNKFWNIMRIWSKCNDVYISSYEAPVDFEVVWECEKRMTLSKKEEKRFERLFKLDTASLP